MLEICWKVVQQGCRGDIRQKGPGKAGEPDGVGFPAMWNDTPRQ